jgi:EPS-associated MarR family transcriptional regulator
MEILKQTSSTRENLGLLAIMDAIDGGDQITQRELAQKTGLNLKKVNYCLRKLLERGLVKFQRVRQNPDKRAYLYVLTPEGIKAKTQLTYGFLKFTMSFYTKVEGKVEKCLKDMQAQHIKHIILYGMSDIVGIFTGLNQAYQIEIVGVVDDSYIGRDIQGISLIAEKEILEHKWDVVLITALDGLDVIEEKLCALSVSPNAVWCMK